MKRAMVVVALLVAACGGSESKGSDGLGMTGDAYCCDGTYEECDAAKADGEQCFPGALGCFDLRPLCIRQATGPVCTRSAPEEESSNVLHECSVDPGSCPADCVPVSVIRLRSVTASALDYDYDVRCVAPDDAASCF